MEVNPPEIFEPLYMEDARYYFLKGGRGSGKSWAVADYLLLQMLMNPDLNLVCLREVQRSIKHSSKKLLSDRIDFHHLHNHFDVLTTEIRMKKGNGVMIFNGLQDHTVDSIKSLEGFSLCWVEEAQTISAHSLELLIPTIRANGSKLFFTYNPKNEDDPIETLRHEKDNKIVIHANYLDNPFVPDSLFDEAEEMKSKNLSKYNHIYLGAYGISVGLIFENVAVRVIKEDEVKDLECLQGLDWGFTDPNTFVILYLDQKNKKLFIMDGFHKNGILNSEIAQRIKNLNAHMTVIRADQAEPKSIMALRSYGIRRIIPAAKGKDSVNAGISFLQEFDIIINAHLTEIINDFKNYVWDTDKKTGKPTNKPNHDFSHSADATRYACSHIALKQGNIGRVQKPRGV